MTKHRNEFYKDGKGIWWARYNGKRMTPNTREAAFELYRAMQWQDEDARRYTGEIPLMNGQEIIALRGLPGSGKTTWARQWVAENPWYKRISKDDLRQMLDNGVYSRANEETIRLVHWRLIYTLASEGHCLVVDDTNLRKRDINRIREASHSGFQESMRNVPVRIVHIDTPLEECIRRDALRPNPVGEARIREMAEEFEL